MLVSKNLLITFITLLFLINYSCSDDDIIPDPYVFITSPLNSTEIFEEISVVCSTNIENGEIFDFYLRQSSGELIYKIGQSVSSPHTINFNTVTDSNSDGQPDLEDGDYLIEVYNEENQTGDTVSVILNNNLASPSPVNILSITSTSPDGNIGIYDIIWNQSQNEDFAKYVLEYSNDLENFENNFQTIHEIEYSDSNSFTFITGSLLEDRYFRVKVVDKYNLSSKGQIFLSEGKIQPELLKIVSLTYDTTNFYISWNRSNDSDFSFYEIKCSNAQENGAEAHQVLEEIYDISDTSISINGFSPVRENYFFVRQVNNSGLRPGWHVDDWVERRNPSTNLTRSQTILLDSLYVSVIGFDCDANPITFSWEQSEDPFFSFYELAWRDGITNGEKLILDTIYNKDITESNIIFYDSNVEWNQYYVHVYDYWGTMADGNHFGRLEQFCD